LSGVLFALFVVTGSGVLYAMARRDHRSAAVWRAHLLDRVASVLPQARIAMRPDGFPALTGRLSDGRKATIELIPDTLVFRRLPELWLIVTIAETMDSTGSSIGGLARPTGAEFYAMVPALPHLLQLPDGAGAVLVKGSNDISVPEAGRLLAELARLFEDEELKEIVATPRLTRVVRHAAAGHRGAHLLLRQTRFAIDAIPPELVSRALADAEALRAAQASPLPASSY